ncbi:MAG: hypothetical protein KDJ52_00315 [Anaerolineae bacterium]|nr:hypothetical protein [Anaerolineae bacterium]
MKTIDWRTIVAKLFTKHPEVNGVGFTKSDSELGVYSDLVFAVSPDYSFIKALVKAMKEDGIDACSFEIPGGEVLIINGLPVDGPVEEVREKSQGTSASVVDRHHPSC